MKSVYIPTDSELAIIKSANTAFLKTYLSFILVGFGTSFVLLKKTHTKLRSKYGFLTVFGVSMTSEIIGRKVGKSFAKKEFERLDNNGELMKLIKSSGEFDGKVLAFPNHASKSVDDFYVGVDGRTYPKGSIETTRDLQNDSIERVKKLEGVYTVDEGNQIALEPYEKGHEKEKKATNQYGDIIE
jgi:hypothetical protein